MTAQNDMPAVLANALALARRGVPVLMLRAGKLPLGNCRRCQHNACGGRPNMKTPGPCACPAPCHAWAAATTNPGILLSPAWAAHWREAAALAYHPGGAGLTVLDLDTPDAVTWARSSLPRTRTVPTTRGEHWIYLGVMQSANHVRPGTDIKSHAAYARWLGPGIGTMTDLPDAVRALATKEETTPAPDSAGVVSSTPGGGWSRTTDHGCRHTERYVRTGLARGVALICEHHESGAGSQTFGVARFLAAQHTQCPGPCGLDTIARDLIDAAASVGVPHDYATRAVTRGFTAAGAHLT
ncbi:bifunctional DNA primase/polymerase [Kitasatospora sp. NPDC056181]|uniref:bifunctional DNA primase/polymerase n=1 Tax=Kitasatospora sp. NPDC056181 TaxID=3345737 RepID=UPI0035D9388B